MSKLQRLRAWEANTTHGMSKTPEYQVWRNMKARCLRPSHTAYKNYGGRGITICDRWLKFEGFFLDMGQRPSLSHSLERKDNNRGYEPSNCEWTTKRNQQQNTRACWMITHQGRTLCAAEWCRILGLNERSVNYRLRHGWNPVEAITVPLEINKPKRRKDK